MGSPWLGSQLQPSNCQTHPGRGEEGLQSCLDWIFLRARAPGGLVPTLAKGHFQTLDWSGNSFCLFPIWKSEMNNTMIINEPLDKPDVSQRHRVENHKVILDRYFRVI